ncbi:MAG TPA: amidohydrolase family protein [bacterium]|nr:amidohydrolase family protein [bacterium]
MGLMVDVHIQAGVPGEQLDPFAHSRLRKVLETRAFNFDGSRPRERALGPDPIAALDEAGIDVICLIAGDYNRALPGAVESQAVPNDHVAGIVARYPGRIAGTCSVDPITDPPAAVREIERCAAKHGFRAVRLYPAVQQWDPRDERLYPIYRRCIELDMLVQMHMGWTPVVTAHMEYQRPWLLDEVGRIFPELKLMISHLAYPYVDECTCVIARHENFYADISFWAPFHPSKILRMLVDFGALCSFDRLLYGSSNPFFRTYPKVIRSLNGIADRYGLPPIPEADLRKIMGENACRLWKIDPARMGRASQNRQG